MPRAWVAALDGDTEATSVQCGLDDVWPEPDPEITRLLAEPR